MEALTNRMKEIEEEAQLIRQMQSDVEKQMNMSTGSNTSQSVASIEDKIEADSRSIYVGNVRILIFFKKSRCIIKFMGKNWFFWCHSTFNRYCRLIIVRLLRNWKLIFMDAVL